MLGQENVAHLVQESPAVEEDALSIKTQNSELETPHLTEDTTIPDAFLMDMDEPVVDLKPQLQIPPLYFIKHADPPVKNKKMCTFNSCSRRFTNDSFLLKIFINGSVTAEVCVFKSLSRSHQELFRES